MNNVYKKWIVFFMIISTPLLFLLCLSIGSVNYPLSDIVNILLNREPKLPSETIQNVILKIRLPRICTVALVGASLSLCGAAIQGLLKNPLADGSTLGVSSGSSLGAVCAIALSTHFPFLGKIGITTVSICFAFFSMFFILSLAHILDYSLSTNTILLVGIIYSMLAGSITNMVLTFSGDKVKNIIFWTMGSFASVTFQDTYLMLSALLICGTLLFYHSTELNAFAMGEENALHLGVDIRHIKLIVMISVSILLGISVSISGHIGFVGLIIPHISRFITGPNHDKLLPFSMWLGSIFLLLCDLISRVAFSPKLLPIGVVTSFIGSLFFIYIFYTRHRKR